MLLAWANPGALEVLAPLPVAVPLLTAAGLLAIGFVGKRWMYDAAALAASLAAAAISVVLAGGTMDRPIVYWFGGWRPSGGVAVGIAFLIEPLGAGMAALAGLLFSAALIFTWHYFDAVRSLFHALMLIFLAALSGFCLSGDFFNLFVFLELMSVSAYALTAYKIEETGPIQGAFNFAVMNTLGALLMLTGIGLLYARTGALNLAQMGLSLSSQPVDALVLAALVLVTTGLLTKAAIFPFHFWLPDAHAVAPAPVSVIFSGIMVPAGLLALSRVYVLVFAPALGGWHAHVLTGAIILGGISAVLGGVMCLLQRHLKRILAFSTISHVGLVLAAGALLQSKAWVGTAMYIFSHGCIKSGLFLCAGVILHRTGSVDELRLAGKCRRLGWTSLAFLLLTISLAAAPPLGLFFAKAHMEEAANEIGQYWLTPLALAVSILTGGTLLRVWLTLFTPWGRPSQAPGPPKSDTTKEEPETHGPHGRTPPVLLVPIYALLVFSLLPLWPSVPQGLTPACRLWQDGPDLARQVMTQPQAMPPGEGLAIKAHSVLLGVLGLAAAVVLAVIMSRPRQAGPLYRLLQVADPLRRLQSGRVGDYVAWMSLGLAGLLLYLLWPLVEHSWGHG